LDAVHHWVKSIFIVPIGLINANDGCHLLLWTDVTAFDTHDLISIPIFIYTISKRGVPHANPISHRFLES
jgi:hypothetical protein